jgi:hypothetical protein
MEECDEDYLANEEKKEDEWIFGSEREFIKEPHPR